MRGEIFFSERWLIVEGQTDYLLVHAVAHAMDYDLDRHGVSVIDAQNNGKPVIFAALARALDIPWLAVFDGDEEGERFIRSIEKRGFDKGALAKRCRKHPIGDLEAQLVADGLGQELREVLATLDIRDAYELDEGGLVTCLRNNKRVYAAELAARIRCEPNLTQRAPEAFRQAIE